MAPETADLIEEIDSERERVDRVLEDADEELKVSDEVSARIASEMLVSREALAKAIESLRRAGLLKTRR